MKSIKRNLGFTLAEILIVIGVIGVVAALTIPTLIKNHQKKVYYTQFMKANSILQQAIKMYKYENETDDLDSTEAPFYKEFPKYVKVAYSINEDNYEEICKGYTRLGISSYVNGSDRDYDVSICEPAVNTDKTYAYITADGMLINFYSDYGVANGRVIDLNGPDKGPNTFGRDIFLFYMHNWDNLEECGLFWAGKSKFEADNGELDCTKDNLTGTTCAGRLLRDGKMNY